MKVSKKNTIQQREFTIDGTTVIIKIGDIFLLSPQTYSRPDVIKKGKVISLFNPENDEDYFNIRLDKFYWDFRNFHKIVGIIRIEQCKLEVKTTIKVY
jgi:hypothetical protein